MRAPIVGVMGSGTSEHVNLASPLGEWLGRQGVHLLTGGGGGVMTAVSRAFVEARGRTGLSIGVLPASGDQPGEPPAGYPNAWIEIPIRTHLPLSGASGTDVRSRNHVNILSATVIVALPGGAGTASEIELAVTYARPVIAFHGGRSMKIPDGVPCTADFQEVKHFVTRHLQTR